jgi:peptide/nickel transport system permease protein
VAFAPFIAPYSPVSQNLARATCRPGTGVTFRGPEGQFGIWVPGDAQPRYRHQRRHQRGLPCAVVRPRASWTWFFGLVRSDLHLFGVDGPVRFYALGTDEQGRDILSRLIHGAWISMFIGLISIAIGIGIGVPIGAISGSSVAPPT